MIIQYLLGPQELPSFDELQDRFSGLHPWHDQKAWKRQEILNNAYMAGHEYALDALDMFCNCSADMGEISQHIENWVTAEKADFKKFAVAERRFTDSQSLTEQCRTMTMQARVDLVCCVEDMIHELRRPKGDLQEFGDNLGNLLTAQTILEDRYNYERVSPLIRATYTS